MSDIQREESFRSAIKNQKRRLSATKIEKRNSLTDTGRPSAVPSKLNLKKRDSLTPPRRDGWTPPPRVTMTPPPRTAMTPPPPSQEEPEPREDSKQSTPDIRLEFYDIAELSPLSTPGCSPRASPTQDLRAAAAAASRSPSPRPRSAVPPGSPLLSPHHHQISPALKRARSFNKDLRRARSFRAQREKSCSRSSSLANSRCVTPEPEVAEPVIIAQTAQEVSFSIKRALGSRKGWKIMPDDGHIMDGEALKRVVNMIKDIEYQGFAVPERITIKVP